jgi:hypothetical protein
MCPGQRITSDTRGHELGAFIGNALEVWRFTDPQTILVADQLHPADVIAHDEQELGFFSSPATAALRAAGAASAAVPMTSF